MSDILSFLLWYLAISAVGIAAFPISFRFFSHLPERGAALARPLGLLLWAYVFWLLTSLGVLQNDLGGEIIAFAVLAIGAIVALRGGYRENIVQWVRSNWKTLLHMEVVFLVLFAGWAVVRAANPDILYTEKPMELAFINAILKSPAFPPQDPWLSGYSISYYYFGYVMIAMLTRITGVLSGVAFNLSSALWFGMVGATAYGVVYDLLAFRQSRKTINTDNAIQTAKHQRFSRLGALLGPFFILIVSNFEGLLEILYARGLFWKSDGTSNFWNWLGIADLNVAPTQPVSWFPNRPASWLWWRGSRVLQDTNLFGGKIEIIDEFPFFSYLLSDLHPHVLAMPFALMAIGVCLNLFIKGTVEPIANTSQVKWIKHWELWLTALILGSMAFLNTWNFPIYVGLFCLVAAYLRTHELGWSGKRVGEFLVMGIGFAVIGVVLFLPFYIGFKSQAGGILPSLEFITPGINFWVMFGPLLIPILTGLLVLFARRQTQKNIQKGLQFAVIVLLGLWIFSTLLGIALFNFDQWGSNLIDTGNPIFYALGSRLKEAAAAFTAYVHGGADASTILSQSLVRRFAQPGAWITLFLMIAACWGLLAGGIKKQDETGTSHEIKGYEFAVILALLGAGLALFPEFMYLRDQFGTRMNTIFKFYFEAWVLWGVVAAFASAVLLRELKGILGAFFRVFWILVIACALTYPVIMIINKTNNFHPSEWTLDGNANLKNYHPDDYAAIEWLKAQPLGTVSEAVGGSYTDYARISTQTGYPTVLGWPGHESQWRGGAAEMGSRQTDIETLYSTPVWDEAYAILHEYQIRYIYIGALERTTYPVNENKFLNILQPAYQNGSVTIYEIPDSLLNLGK